MTRSFSHEADVARLNNSGHTGIKLQHRAEIQAVCFNALLAHVYHGHLITDTPAALVLTMLPLETGLKTQSSCLSPRMLGCRNGLSCLAFSPISLPHLHSGLHSLPISPVSVTYANRRLNIIILDSNYAFLLFF